MAQNSRISAAEQEHIGTALRTFRELSKITKTTLSNAMGISYAYLSNIEAGRKRLTPDLADRAVAALDIDPRALYRADLFDAERAVAA